MTSELSNFAARLRAAFALKNLGDDGFNRFARDLFNLQFTHNAPYRKFCQARGVVPEAIGDWRNIPAVPTVAFKELELSCLPREQRTTVFYSSGTTEHRPSRHFHSTESLALYEASLLSWFRDHISPGGQLIALTPAIAAAPHSSLVHMFEVIRCDAGESESVFVGRTTRDGSWSLDFGAVPRRLEAAGENSTRLILLGTAFSFVHLLDHLVEKKLRFRLPPGSLAMETGGYKGRSRALPKAELHALITERLGIPAANIVCEYGMSELSSQAYDATRQKAEGRRQNEERIFRFPPWVRVQIISPETGREVTEGETGLLRVFDLANVFSVMAIQTEDLAIRRTDGFELIGRAEAAEARGCSLMADASVPVSPSALE